jgi:hypothetical protein
MQIGERQNINLQETKDNIQNSLREDINKNKKKNFTKREKRFKDHHEFKKMKTREILELINDEKISKNVKKSYNYRKIKQLTDNFIICRIQKEQNNNIMLEMPSTPHNTTQFLTENYCEGRTSKLMNFISEYNGLILKDLNYLFFNENLATDDLCVTGGTMKGIINTKYLELFESSLNNFEDETSESTDSKLSRSNSVEEEYLEKISWYKDIIQQQSEKIKNLQKEVMNNE